MKQVVRTVKTRLLRSTVLAAVCFLGMLAFPPVASLGEWGGVSHGYAPFWVLSMPAPWSGPLLQIEASRLLSQVLILMLVHATYVAYALFVGYAELAETRQ